MQCQCVQAPPRRNAQLISEYKMLPNLLATDSSSSETVEKRQSSGERRKQSKRQKSSNSDLEASLGAVMNLVTKQCSSNKGAAAQMKNLFDFVRDTASNFDKIAKKTSSEAEKELEINVEADQFIGDALDKIDFNAHALELCKKEKNDLQKKFQEVEKKLKETQEEMKRYKKISMEVIEKKKDEIQKLENGDVLLRKDVEMKNLKTRHQKILQEKNQILEDVKNEMKNLEKTNKNLKLDKEKIQVSHSKLIQKKEEDLEKLEKEKKILEEKATKSDDLEKQLKEIQKEMAKKNEENEKLKQGNLKLIKGKEEEIDKMKKGQSQENRERKKEMDHLKVDNLQLSNQKKDLMIRISQKEEAEVQLKGENKKLVDKVRTLEQSMTRLEKSAENDQLKMAIRLNKLETQITEKNRLISEIQESSQREISEKDKIIRELRNKIQQSSEIHKDNTAFRKTPTCLQNRQTSSESSSRLLIHPECLQMPFKSFKALNKYGYTLCDLQFKKDTLDVNSMLNQALDMRDRIISLTDLPEIREMAEVEYQQYEGRLRKYQRAIEMNIQLLEGHENVGFAIPIPEFPTLPSHFTSEYWSAIREQDKENLKFNFN